MPSDCFRAVTLVLLTADMGSTTAYRQSAPFLTFRPSAQKLPFELWLPLPRTRCLSRPPLIHEGSDGIFERFRCKRLGEYPRPFVEVTLPEDSLFSVAGYKKHWQRRGL